MRAIVWISLEYITAQIKPKNLSRIRMPHDAVNRCPEIVQIIRITSTSANKFWGINAPDREREPTICHSNVSGVRAERDTTRRVCNSSVKGIVFSQEPL